MADTNQEVPTVIYEPPSKGIRIIIDKLQNIKNRLFPFEVNIKVEYKGEVIGELNDVKVDNEESTQIGSDIYYKMAGPITTEILDDLTANPFLITVTFKGDVPDKNMKRQKKQSQKSPKLSKKSNKSPKSSKTSKESTADLDKQNIKMQQYFGILGQTNLDILPLLTGEASQTEVLILESSQTNKGSSITSWANLPQLMVSTELIAGTMEGVIPYNILYFTLEAMYNVMPELLEPGTSCEVYTALPLVGHSADEYSLVTFTNYEIQTSPISESHKRWLNLSHIPGRSAVSKYRLNDNILDIKNTVQVNLNEKLNASSPRLEWNALRRCWVQEAMQKEIFDKLVKFRCWPVEFKIKTIEPKGKASPKKGKNKEKEIPPEEPKNHYIAFLDISNLLYPGVTQTRVTGQLYTYTDDEMKQKFGRDYAFTSPPPPSPEQLPQIQSLDQLSKSQRYRYDSKDREGKKDKHTSSGKNESPKAKQPSSSPPKEKSPNRSKDKADEKAGTSTRKEQIKSAKNRLKKPEEIQNFESAQEEQISMPVFTEDGQPVFIIVEVQLEKPLKEKRTKEEIRSCISELIPARPEPDPLAVDAQMAEDNYRTCINNIITVIEQQYNLFRSQEAPLPENIEKNFLMHLHQTGKYRKITEMLRESVILYVRNKIGPPKSGITECEYQNYIQQTYLKLVEEMFRVVNSLVDEHPPKERIYNPGVTVDDLHYYAIEAWEQSNYDKAKVYLLECLEHSNKMDPQHWIDYGVFCVLQSDYEMAHECAREALSLDVRHKNGLLFHALFSWLTENYKEAELFFSAVTTFYPYFPEGWFAFKLFAEESEQPYVASVAYITGIKCLHNRLQDSKDFDNDSTGVFLSWSPLISECDRPFLLTAALMLKFGFPELAEISLSRDLSEQAEPTVTYLYLLAVSHYMQGRYEESNTHLTQGTHLDWENTQIWALIGHNNYKMGQKQEAQKAYKFVIDSPNRPINIPLIHLRYGLCMMEENNYLDAKEKFLLACTYGPSPLSWLGLGTACYMLSDMEDAEMALSEANMLDHRLAEVWAYLALINLHMCHKDQYKHCYAQAMMYGLNDTELLDKIHTFKALLSPDL